MPPQPASPDAPITPDPLEEIKDEEEISAKYLSMFLDEAEASLEAFGSGLLALEGAGNSDGLKALVGIAHKIKGSAASVGLHRAAKLTHLIEDRFEQHQASGRPLSPPTTDLLLQCADARAGMSRT